MLLTGLNYNWDGRDFKRFHFFYDVFTPRGRDLVDRLKEDSSKIDELIRVVFPKHEPIETCSCSDGCFSFERAYLEKGDRNFLRVNIPNLSLTSSVETRNKNATVNVYTSQEDSSLNLRLYDLLTCQDYINLSKRAKEEMREIAVLREGVNSPQDFVKALIS